MIQGVHAMFYSSNAAEVRAFVRDKLGLPCTDVGQGWLIFDLPEAEVGSHPASAEDGKPSGTHDISFYCDDIEETVSDLEARGVSFTAPVADHGYGLVTHFSMPGGIEVQLYQPKYTKRLRPAKKAKPATKAKRPGRARKSSSGRKKKSAKRR